ncbi:YNFM family putative membrane transporter [Pullulanibacillus pueri]|uniref:MFS transporter n=1 Tax=Pullulanibacillus pueri TaxID=1437324 RepID=UPI001667E29F|nr:MFS transporter [Pullulanibacillus pueri]MBM7682299.1 YNFM family putative membrane transporter [Pullulanibacillus pueri]
MDYIKSGTKTFRHASLALFAGGFVTFSNLYTTQPLMPVFSKTFHISPTIASLTLSVSTAALAIFMLVAAAISDAIGRKRIMVISIFATSILAFLTSFSPNFITLLSLRTLLGAVLAGVPAIAMAYVGEEFDPKSLGQAMGLYISGNSIGGLFGRLATGVLTDLFNWHVALQFVGALSIAFSLYLWFALPKPQHFQPSRTSFSDIFKKLGGHLKQPGLFLLFTIGFLLMGSFVTMFNYIGYLLTEPPYNVSQTVIGFIFIVYLMGTWSSAWMGKVADRLGASPVIQRSLLLMLLGSLLTLVPNLYVKIIALAIFTFGFFGAHAVASGWVGDRAKINKAQASSLYLLFYYAGSSLVGAFGGFFWSGFGWIGVIILITLLILLGFLCTYYSNQYRQNSYASN